MVRTCGEDGMKEMGEEYKGGSFGTFGSLTRAEPSTVMFAARMDTSEKWALKNKNKSYCECCKMGISEKTVGITT